MNTALLTLWSQDFGARFPRRLTRKQKEGFLSAIKEVLQTRDYETEQTKIRHWGIPNRVLLTKCKKPKVIFLAHYDTPTIMPPGISPIYRLFGHTRQGISSIFLIVLMLALFIFHSWLEIVGLGYWATAYLVVISLLFVVPIFFPNPFNAEDNTSGVLSLLALADWIADKPYKDAVQFVFLDNEEWGLIGSQALKKRWQKQGHLHSETIIINLDCVSRGRKPLVVYHKNDRMARKVLPFIQSYLPETEIFDMKHTPLSDNFTFRKEGAINISYTNPSIIPGGFYIPGIHSPNDRAFFPEKTALLIDESRRFSTSETFKCYID